MRVETVTEQPFIFAPLELGEASLREFTLEDLQKEQYSGTLKLCFTAFEFWFQISFPETIMIYSEMLVDYIAREKQFNI